MHKSTVIDIIKREYTTYYSSFPTKLASSSDRNTSIGGNFSLDNKMECMHIEYDMKDESGSQKYFTAILDFCIEYLYHQKEFKILDVIIV